MMKNALLAFVMVFLLSACEQAIPVITPSPTVENPAPAKNNIAPTPLPSPTPYPTDTAIPTATEWIKTYPTKTALIIYGTEWRNEYTINFSEWGDFYLEPYFVLYEDGQLIFGTGAYKKQLPLNETKEILSKLEQSGLFQIQDTYAADPQNPIYHFPDGMTLNPNLNLPSVVLTVNGQTSKSIRYKEEWEKYLTQPMKEIITYLNSISSDGAIRYQPDRLLVSVESVEGKQFAEDEKVVPWPSDVTSPAHLSYMGVLYLEGAEALRFYEAAGENLFGTFSFEGKKYKAYIRPILPHECHIYHIHNPEDFFEQAQPYFTCDDW